jgi:hypothetical protein
MCTHSSGLVCYDGPHAGEPTSERGEIERLARECKAANCVAGLASTVVETRFNVVRSSLPAVMETVRMLRDYLPSEDWAASVPADGPARADAAHRYGRATPGAIGPTGRVYPPRRVCSTAGGRGGTMRCF